MTTNTATLTGLAGATATVNAFAGAVAAVMAGRNVDLEDAMRLVLNEVAATDVARFANLLRSLAAVKAGA